MTNRTETSARDRIEGAFVDAIGRVIARVELYDEAVEQGAHDTQRQLLELLNRCRELKLAFDAKYAFDVSPSSDSGASR